MLTGDWPSEEPPTPRTENGSRPLLLSQNTHPERDPRDPLEAFIDNLTGRSQYMKTLPKFKKFDLLGASLLSEVTVKSMKGHNIMRGRGKVDNKSSFAPFIAFCVKTANSETKEEANLEVYFLTTCTAKEKDPAFLLIINNGKLEYTLGENLDHIMCRNIIKPLIEGDPISGFEVDSSTQSVVRSIKSKIVLSDQSEFKKRCIIS